MLDTNLERAHGSNSNDLELQEQSSKDLKIKHPPLNLVNGKWRHLRPKESLKFQRYKKKFDHSKKILLQLNAESLQARKHKTMIKRRSQSQTRKKTKE